MPIYSLHRAQTKGTVPFFTLDEAGFYDQGPAADRWPRFIYAVHDFLYSACEIIHTSLGQLRISCCNLILSTRFSIWSKSTNAHKLATVSSILLREFLLLATSSYMLSYWRLVRSSKWGARARDTGFPRLVFVRKVLNSSSAEGWTWTSKLFVLGGILLGTRQVFRKQPRSKQSPLPLPPSLLH